MSTEGGLLWSKPRNDGSYHILLDTERYSTPPSTGGWLSSNATDAESASGAGSVTTWNTDGFTVKSNGALNFATQNNVFWTFRKAPKFFDSLADNGATVFKDDHESGQHALHIQWDRSTEAQGEQPGSSGLQQEITEESVYASSQGEQECEESDGASEIDEEV